MKVIFPCPSCGVLIRDDNPDRKFLIELSLPDKTEEELHTMQYWDCEISMADLAFRVREYLEENT